MRYRRPPDLETRLPAPDTAEPRPRRATRLRLFLPAGLLLVLAVLWSIGWLVLRGRAAAEVDAFLAREAAAGRSWTCPDRSVGGYPFRIEVVCPSLAFERADFSAKLGRVVAVAQVYRPTHVIVEAAGPLAVSRGPVTAAADWRLLQASVQLAVESGRGRLERLSVATDDLDGRADAGGGPVAFAARHLEVHARPDPARFAGEGAVDASLRAEGARVPALDPVLGGAEPADLALDVTASRATQFGGGPLAIELERWRAAGGGLDVTQASVVKGPRRLRARGTLALDDAHRLAGRLEIEAAGLEALLGPILGQRLGTERGALVGGLIGGLLGGLSGSGRPRGEREARIEQAPQGAPGEPRLTPLPPLVLADGRVRLGPFPLPVMLLPLY
jgi:hypothetical protein